MHTIVKIRTLDTVVASLPTGQKDPRLTPGTAVGFFSRGETIPRYVSFVRVLFSDPCSSRRVSLYSVFLYVLHENFPAVGHWLVNSYNRGG